MPGGIDPTVRGDGAVIGPIAQPGDLPVLHEEPAIPEHLLLRVYGYDTAVFKQ